jgi:hypothetical protein
VDILLIKWVHRVAQTTHLFHWLEDELIGKPFMWQYRAQRIVEMNVCNNFSWFHCQSVTKRKVYLVCCPVLTYFQ